MDHHLEHIHSYEIPKYDMQFKFAKFTCSSAEHSILRHFLYCIRGNKTLLRYKENGQPLADSIIQDLLKNKLPIAFNELHEKKHKEYSAGIYDLIFETKKYQFLISDYEKWILREFLACLRGYPLSTYHYRKQLNAKELMPITTADHDSIVATIHNFLVKYS